ncbi:MAG TPA: site-specific integrase [Desulfatiglandales bacterium]|nr:site-specific integrase [Desulfatiglandales bacterium]
MITPKLIDEWLMDLDSVRYGIPLAPGSLDKVLVAMRIILAEAEYQGFISWHGKNPAEKVEPYDRRESRGRRQPFSIEEIHVLFPPDLSKALEIWQTPGWYAYFLMQWVTGMRPGEVSGFMLKDWVKEYHGAVIERSIEHRTYRIKGLKTEKRGLTVKAVFFSDQLEEILSYLESHGAPTEDLLFRSVTGKPVILETANKHFKASVVRAGLGLNSRTQYSLKHSFYTEALKHMAEADVAKLAGHRYLRKEYDHRKAIDFLKKKQGLKRLVDRINAA